MLTNIYTILRCILLDTYVRNKDNSNRDKCVEFCVAMEKKRTKLSIKQRLDADTQKDNTQKQK